MYFMNFNFFKENKACLVFCKRSLGPRNTFLNIIISDRKFIAKPLFNVQVFVLNYLGKRRAGGTRLMVIILTV